MLLQLVLALAGEAAHLTDQTFTLVPQLVAAQLVSTVTPVRALVTLVPVGTSRTGQAARGSGVTQEKDGKKVGKGRKSICIFSFSNHLPVA